jgi:hypothetical protein
LMSLDLLHTDMLDNVKAYLNSTLKPIRMKDAAGDVEMTGQFKKVLDAYEAKILNARKADNWDLADSLQQEKNLNVTALEAVRDRYYGRTKAYEGRAATVANIARAIRNLNVFRMMGGVLTTSMNDVARLNAARIYTPELKASGPGLVNAWRTLRKGQNKQALEKAGFAAETTGMARFTKLVDMGVPILAGGRRSQAFLNMTAKGAMALMKATLLTQWTDFMKMTAAVMVQDQTVFMMKNYGKLSGKNKTILAEMGIDERLAKAATEQFEAHGERFGKYGTSLNWDDWVDKEAAERMKDVMFRQSERLLVTPRETDLPLVLADNELGRAFLQFKSFSLAAHNQTTVPMLERAQTGDLMAVYAMAMMSVGAVPTEIIKMFESGREDQLKDYSAADWGFAIADRSAVAPMLSMAFNNIDLGLGNRITKEFNARPTSRYSDRSILGAFGPTASTIGDMVRFSAGFAGDELDYRDARSFRRLLPFQNYMLLNRLATEMMPKKTGTKYNDR